MREETSNGIIGFVLLVLGYLFALISASMLFVGHLGAWAGGYSGHRLSAFFILAVGPTFCGFIAYYLVSRDYPFFVRFLAFPLLILSAGGILFALFSASLST